MHAPKCRLFCSFSLTLRFIHSPISLIADRVGRQAQEGDTVAEQWLAQAMLSLDGEHLEMLTAVDAENEPTYTLPTGTYELPLRLHDPVFSETQASIGLVQLRLASFAASPICSWWVPDGLIALLHTEPSQATFLAFLGAVQRCNPQQVSRLLLCLSLTWIAQRKRDPGWHAFRVRRHRVQADAIFGAATPIDLFLCFPTLLEHLKPLNHLPADTAEFALGCTALSLLLGCLTDDVMAHPSVSQRAMTALLQAFEPSTLANLVAHLSNTILPKAKHVSSPVDWPGVRGLCWLVSEILWIDGDGKRAC